MEAACLHLARKLADRLNLSNLKKIDRVSEINAAFFKQLFETVCVPYIIDPPTLPDPRIHAVQVLDEIIELVGDEFLNFDIFQYCRPEEIINGNLYAVHYLLVIFDNLCDCLFTDTNGGEQRVAKGSAEPSETAGTGTGGKKRRTSADAAVPVHLRTKLRNFGKKSILYSPRTNVSRGTDSQSKKSRDVLGKIRSRDTLPPDHSQKSGQSKTSSSGSSARKMNLPDVFDEKDVKFLKRCGVSEETIDLLQMENALHRVKLTRLLNLLRAEHRKSETNAKRRLARVILRRSIRDHVTRATHNKRRELLVRRGKLAYENALKDQQRQRYLSDSGDIVDSLLPDLPSLKRATSSGLHSARSSEQDLRSTRSSSSQISTDSAALDLYASIKRADNEARNFLRDFARQQKRTYENDADSVEKSEQQRNRRDKTKE